MQILQRHNNITLCKEQYSSLLYLWKDINQPYMAAQCWTEMSFLMSQHNILALLHYRTTPILGGDKAPLSLLRFSTMHNTYPCCATYFMAILTADSCSQGRALAKTGSQKFPWATTFLTELNTCAMLEEFQCFLRWGGMRWSWYSQDDFYVVQSPLIMTCSVVTGLPPAQ